MNIYTLIAGLLAAFATIGHLTIGKKQFLNPMLAADFDVLPKKVIHSVFHYITVFLLLSALMLIVIGVRGSSCMFDPTLLLVFIGANYFLFAVFQIIIAVAAKISLLKMFQWIFWLLIAVFAIGGVCTSAC
jgi:hypothetical protein